MKKITRQKLVAVRDRETRESIRLGGVVAFRKAAEEAKRVAAELFTDRQDDGAKAVRDLASLLMLCADHADDAMALGCRHVRENSSLFKTSPR